MLDYHLKLKSAHNIRYDATSSTDIFYHKCNIIVLTQSKRINLSFYVWIYWNQVNWLWVKMTDYWNFKNNCSVNQLVIWLQFTALICSCKERRNLWHCNSYQEFSMSSCLTFKRKFFRTWVTSRLLSGSTGVTHFKLCCSYILNRCWQWPYGLNKNCLH